MGRSIQPGFPKGDFSKGIVSVQKGGTGASNSLSAVSNLGGLFLPNMNKAGYGAKLTSAGLVNLSHLPDSIEYGSTLQGPSYLYPAQVAQYTITNFDSLQSYTITASDGSVINNGETFIYKAPALSKSVTLTINNRSYTLTVGPPAPNKPTLAVATAGNNKNAAGILTGSVFSMNYPGPTHLHTDWQIANDSSFTSMVLQDLDDGINKIVWMPSPLALNSSYYARVRYQSNNGQYSDWSDAVAFTTKTKYTPTAEEALMAASDKVTTDYFGFSVAIDGTGTRVIVGAYQANISGLNNAGAAYVFFRSGSSWTQENKLQAQTPVAGHRFGYCVSISSDGARVAIGTPTGKSSVAATPGVVHTYTRIGTGWQYETIFYDPLGVNSDNFGLSCMISGDSTRLVIGAPNHNPGGKANAGTAYIFYYNGTGWFLDARLVAYDGTTTDNFGNSVAISYDGKRVAIGAQMEDTTITNTGAVYVYSLSNITWTIETKLLATGDTSSAQFGSSVALSGDGLRLVVGAYLSSFNAYSQAGTAYVYVLKNGAWTLETRLNALDMIAGDNFGTSVSIDYSGEKIAVGAAIGHITGFTNAGSAYVFNRVDTVWTFENKLSASNANANAGYGCSVDLTNDGSRLVIGAYKADPGSIVDAGSSYVYV